MQLTKLEINGFKSFAKRTELIFEPGITGILGPNGCGKSIIADAFRLVGRRDYSYGGKSRTRESIEEILKRNRKVVN